MKVRGMEMIKVDHDNYHFKNSSYSTHYQR
jgi:hypothetical protein